MTAGVGMAIIAIIADRMTAAWSAKLQARYAASPAQ
jgi:ABC-type proline/glycine betaine transport system permease subunit